MKSFSILIFCRMLSLSKLLLCLYFCLAVINYVEVIPKDHTKPSCGSYFLSRLFCIHVFSSYWKFVTNCLFIFLTLLWMWFEPETILLEHGEYQILWFWFSFHRRPNQGQEIGLPKPNISCFYHEVWSRNVKRGKYSFRFYFICQSK